MVTLIVAAIALLLTVGPAFACGGADNNFAPCDGTTPISSVQAGGGDAGEGE